MNASAPLSSLSASGTAELDRLFALQRSAFDSERFPDLATRRERLRRLMQLTVENESRIVSAIAQDFGHRSQYETRLTECYVVTSAIRHAQKHLQRWMRPMRVATPVHLMPARSEIIPQPVGVVGVISPWN